MENDTPGIVVRVASKEELKSVSPGSKIVVCVSWANKSYTVGTSFGK